MPLTTEWSVDGYRELAAAAVEVFDLRGHGVVAVRQLLHLARGVHLRAGNAGERRRAAVLPGDPGYIGIADAVRAGALDGPRPNGKEHLRYDR